MTRPTLPLARYLDNLTVASGDVAALEAYTAWLEEDRRLLAARCEAAEAIVGPGCRERDYQVQLKIVAAWRTAKAAHEAHHE